MRISEWSSDVCSSDLPSQLVDRIIGGARTVNKDSAVTFKSGSYDPDGPDSPLEHSWQCRTIPNNTPCGSFSATSTSTWLFKPNTASSSGPLPPGKYKIMLSVLSIDDRSAATEVSLNVVN